MRRRAWIAAGLLLALPASAWQGARLAERAHDDREITYDLGDPTSHAFEVRHTNTENRLGLDRYTETVRQGSTVASVTARNLDTGEALPAEIRKGEEGKDTVVVRLPPIPEGGSVRFRASEAYADPQAYRLEEDGLVFDRILGRARNTVILPAGWYLTAASMPAMVSETPDGRIRLDFVNPRNDNVAALIKARRRP
ncbi:MAG: hypothetical protein ACJ75H_05530 [Thermoanaerobaculia bacterium]